MRKYTAVFLICHCTAPPTVGSPCVAPTTTATYSKTEKGLGSNFPFCMELTLWQKTTAMECCRDGAVSKPLHCSEQICSRKRREVLLNATPQQDVEAQEVCPDGWLHPPLSCCWFSARSASEQEFLAISSNDACFVCEVDQFPHWPSHCFWGERVVLHLCHLQIWSFPQGYKN